MFRTTVSVVILRRRDSSFNPCLDLLDELAAQQPDNFSPFSPSLAEARDIAEEKQREPKQAGDLNLEINKEHVSQARTVVKLFDYYCIENVLGVLKRISTHHEARKSCSARH